MEHRTDKSGLQLPGRDAVAPSAGLPAHEPPSTDGPAAASINASAGQAAQRLVTGQPSVDAALARLDELPELPVTEHRAVFEHVHRSLSEVLGELDAGLPPGGRAAGGAEGADGTGDRAENARGARQDLEGAGSGES
jgi:hypothetical protein